MAVCIADAVYQAEFTLENRDGMNYPVLLGRRVIQHLGTIDVTRTFLHEPDCDQGSPVLKIAEKS